MHEFSLMNNLMAKILAIADENSAQHVTRVEVWLGALCHLSASHFRDHFNEAARGTMVDGASLRIEVSEDIHHPRAADIRLLGIDVL